MPITRSLVTGSLVTRSLGAAALALLLALPGAAFAEHAHDNHGAAAAELTLDHGRKWPTDAPLRQGMGEMRAMLTTALDGIHAGRFTPADYASLANRLQAQVDGVVANCKLPENADAQLHIVLGEMIEGINGMKSGAKNSDAATRVALALNAYGRYFDHPGWAGVAVKPSAH